MIQISELKGLIAKNGLSQRKLAKALGITEKTFYTKMKKGVFKSAEMEAMIDILQINDPATIFLAGSNLTSYC